MEKVGRVLHKEAFVAIRYLEFDSYVTPPGESG
jgi:hypothetical protein